MSKRVFIKSVMIKTVIFSLVLSAAMCAYIQSVMLFMVEKKGDINGRYVKG